MSTHPEVVVLVDGASGVRGHVPHGGHVHVLAGEQEHVHAAATGHAVLRQLLKHTSLGLEQSLDTHTHTHCSLCFNLQVIEIKMLFV